MMFDVLATARFSPLPFHASLDILHLRYENPYLVSVRSIENAFPLLFCCWTCTLEASRITSWNPSFNVRHLACQSALSREWLAGSQICVHHTHEFHSLLPEPAQTGRTNMTFSSNKHTNPPALLNDQILAFVAPAIFTPCRKVYVCHSH